MEGDDREFGGAPSPETDGKGDRLLFDALAVSESPALYAFAFSLVRDAEVAADLTQETFARAFEKRAQFRGEAAPATWLRRILHNLAYDMFRRDRDEVVVANVEEIWSSPSYSVDAAELLEQAETAGVVRDALVRIPFVNRAALVLHDVEGLPMREVARVQGVSLPAAKQRLRRGRMMLVTAMDGFSKRQSATEGVPMDCWDARQLVSEYMNDDLKEPERALVESHLATCPTCPPLYASLVGVNEALGRLRDPDSVVPPELVDRIRASSRT